MDTKILGTAVFSALLLNDWLEHKKCPEYAAIFKEQGEKWGVRWDICIFQSCLETGFYSFGGDVKREQNNFFGTGASGNGAPGDSFVSPSEGIEAHMQNMALRAGTKIPVDKIIAPYVRKNYDIISKRNTTMWSQLAGTYAADKEYWNKIQKIMGEYEAWAKDKTEPIPTEEDVTLFKAFNLDSREIGVAAMHQNDKPHATWRGVAIDGLIEFRKRFPKANNIVPAATGLKWYGDMITPQPEPNPKPDPEPVPTPVNKKLFYLEPGHSKSKQGAGSLDPKTNEYEMNELAYAIISQELIRAGHSVKTLNPDPDNLDVVGNGAKGCDCAISIHHNAFDKKVDHYTRNYLCRNPKQSSINLSKKISAAVGKELGLADEGYEESGFTVPSIFNEVCSGPSMLLELYFIDAYSNRAQIIDRTTRAAKAVAKVLIEWAKS